MDLANFVSSPPYGKGNIYIRALCSRISIPVVLEYCVNAHSFGNPEEVWSIAHTNMLGYLNSTMSTKEVANCFIALCLIEINKSLNIYNVLKSDDPWGNYNLEFSKDNLFIVIPNMYISLLSAGKSDFELKKILARIVDDAFLKIGREQYYPKRKKKIPTSRAAIKRYIIDCIVSEIIN